MAEEEPPEEQVNFEPPFRELLLDIWQTNPLSKECRPGLNVRPEGDRLIVFGFHKDTGEVVALARLPMSWLADKEQG